MKKVSHFLYFSLILLLISAFYGVSEVQAQTTQANTAIAIEEKPAILPTNPFYFAKELVRDVRRLFTFGKVNKAEYELQIVDEKALELAETEKLNPKNTTAIKKALENYNENISLLKTRINLIAETSENPNVDKLLDTFTKQSVRHAEILEDVADNEAARDAATLAEESVASVLIDASVKLDSPEKSEARLMQAIELKEEATAQDLEAKTDATIAVPITISPEGIRTTAETSMQVQAVPVTAVSAVKVNSL